MHPCFAVGAINHVDRVRERLQQELATLEGEGVKVKLEEAPTGKATFFFFRLDGSGRRLCKGVDTYALFRQCLAAALSDLILSNWEHLLLRQIIRENYFYFELREQEVIYRLAVKELKKNDGGFLIGGRGQRERKILKKLLDFFRQHDQIVIEGFIRFRLKEYIKDLEEAVEKAVDDYLLEREYREFIQLLRYFVEIQKPRIDLIHVVLIPGRLYGLYDEHGEPLKSENLKEVIDGLGQGEIDYEDLLFSILVSLAPREIVVHPGKKSGGSVFLKTLKNVFRSRVRVCSGCVLCTEEDG